MRKLFFLMTLSTFSYFYLAAQSTTDATSANYGEAFAKNYQANDLYQLELVRPAKEGYALQVATFSSYPNVVKYATDLQGKWFKNVLLKLDTKGGQTIYKVLIGPFPDKNTAVSYQQFAEKQGITGFVTSLEEKKGPTSLALELVETKEAAVEKAAPAELPKPASTKVSQIGEASYYAKKFHGRTTAYGEKFDMNAFTAAHWTLPYNTELKVCRLDNKKCVNVRVNDRGPNPKKAKARNGNPRIIDLSLAAAKSIGLVRAGLAQVSIEVLN